jgi:WXG100 family type VII secretion target
MAGYDGFSYQMQELLQAIDQADATAKQISQQLDTMNGAVQGGLASWTGDARNEYTTRKAGWDATSQEMPTTLTATRVTLEQIAEVYDQAEKAAIQSLAGR